MTHFQTMLAVTLTAFGTPPTLEVMAVDDPVAGPGEVVIDLIAADVIPLDKQIACGFFPPAKTVPLQVGVSAVGRRRDTGRVVSVQGGHVGMGWSRPGCFASSFVAPINVLAELPEGCDPLIAAAGTETAMTALLVLQDHAIVRSGEKVLVLGANGGVGRACMQLATHLGAEVIAAARQPATVIAPAGTRIIGYDQIVGLGADVIVDPVGGPFFQTAILAGAHRCRHVFLGYGAGATVELKLPLLMIAEHRILGFNEHAVGHERVMSVTEEALQLLAQGVFDPLMGASYSLSDSDVAYGAVGTGIGRVLLTP